MTNALLPCPTKRERPSSDVVTASKAGGNYSLTDTRLIQFDFLRATEMAALHCLPWIGKGDKESADAAACDAIRGMFDMMDIRGEIILGEGIKDEAPGLFAGERVGRWRAGTPRVDIAIDPLDGTTNLSKGLPNSISCIAVAVREHENIPALQFVPAFYMKKLAYPSAVRRAWIQDSSLPLDINAPLKEVIALTARLLDKNVHDVVVMVLDRPRNAEIIEEVRSVGAKLRMIVDGDIAAALGPAMAHSGVDLYAGIGGAPEGILAAAGLRCMGGGMQAQMWPRDEQERQSLAQCGWSDRVEKVYRSRDLIHSNDVLFIATGISDSPLLRGVQHRSNTIITHSVLMRQHSGTVRFISTEHDLSRRPLRLRSAMPSDSLSVVPAHSEPKAPHFNMLPARNSPVTSKVESMLLFGPPGSGKGTIGRALASLPGLTHCSSGDIIRAAMQREEGKTDRWKQMATGQLLSDELLWDLLDDYLHTYSEHTAVDSNNNLLLLIDGVPRCRSQVEELAHRVIVRGVLYFDCGDQDQLVHRLVRRSNESRRVDDSAETVIRNRLHLFYDLTQPLLDSYPEEIIHRIDAMQRPDAVLLDVLRCLKKIRSCEVTVTCDSSQLSDSGGSRKMVLEGGQKDGVDRAGVCPPSSAPV